MNRITSSKSAATLRRLHNHLSSSSLSLSILHNQHLLTRQSSSTTSTTAPNNTATIIRGPSLLTDTSHPRPSPTLFHLPGLRSLPFWTPPTSKNSQTTHSVAYNDPTVTRILHHIEKHYPIIKDEYLSSVMGISSPSSPTTQQQIEKKPMTSDYQIEGEHQSLHTGQWDWHSYILNGVKQDRFRERCPQTAACLDGIGDDLFGTPFSFSFFSSLQGGARIKAHTGPMNLRLRFHLPLIVPSSSSSSSITCGIRVGRDVRQWVEGKALILDDSYIHEVWNDTNDVRVLLLFDIWHPDVTQEERRRIETMFEYAKEKGWMGGEAVKGGG